MDLDIELFIEEVKNRPALYDVKSPQYSDRNLKKNLWAELCEIFIDNWDAMTEMEKDGREKELQARWQNLRTCFKREYNAQRKAHLEGPKKKRRSYLYFEQLLFLIDSVENKDTINNVPDKTSEVNDSDTREEVQSANKIKMNGKKRKKSIKSEKSYEDAIFDTLRKKLEEDNAIDEDKYFLLSLLPKFKKFDDEQKYVAKLEILRIMRRLELSGNSQRNNHQQQKNHSNE